VVDLFSILTSVLPLLHKPIIIQLSIVYYISISVRLIINIIIMKSLQNAHLLTNWLQHLTYFKLDFEVIAVCFFLKITPYIGGGLGPCNRPTINEKKSALYYYNLNFLNLIFDFWLLIHHHSQQVINVFKIKIY